MLMIAEALDYGVIMMLRWCSFELELGGQLPVIEEVLGQNVAMIEHSNDERDGIKPQ